MYTLKQKLLEKSVLSMQSMQGASFLEQHVWPWCLPQTWLTPIPVCSIWRKWNLTFCTSTLRWTILMIYIPLWWGVDMVGGCVLNFNQESHTYKSPHLSQQRLFLSLHREEEDYEKHLEKRWWVKARFNLNLVLDKMWNDVSVIIP